MKEMDSGMDRAVLLAREDLARRASRATYFGATAIDDPAWNMIMFLFIEQHRNITIGHICEAALAPRTTCLRQLKLLEDRGLAEHATDPNDRRVRFARLTDIGLDAAKAYLEASDAARLQTTVLTTGKIDPA